MGDSDARHVMGVALMSVLRYLGNLTVSLAYAVLLVVAALAGVQWGKTLDLLAGRLSRSRTFRKRGPGLGPSNPEVVSALVNLGTRRRAAEGAVRKAVKDGAEGFDDTLRGALDQLGYQKEKVQ